ncbi:MAG: PIG-L family deacetylase [Rhodospirillales bacterium]|nr:PIG-L family deacetylase [Rhodospirillales bacterium]
MSNKILVVAAHPDDEVLGCGGTVAKHVEQGDSVQILIVAEGATSREAAAEGAVQTLREAAEKAADAVGAKSLIFLGLPDNRLDSLDLLDVIQKIEAVIGDFQPDTIYTHHGGDLNKDHRIVHEAVVTASRPLPGSTVKKIYTFETVSSTEWATPAIGAPFMPNHFVDISAYMDKKLAALDHYKMEMRDHPHPRSNETLKNLASLRGSQAGVAAAEAFEVILEIC